MMQLEQIASKRCRRKMEKRANDKIKAQAEKILRYEL